MAATAIFAAVTFEIITRHDGATPNLTPALLFGIQMTLAFGPVLLIPSALGWWIGGAFLRLRGPSATPRPAVQGASAGLAAHILFSTEIGWMPPTLIGIPIGALVGCLVFIRWFPMLPDIAVRDADA